MCKTGLEFIELQFTIIVNLRAFLKRCLRIVMQYNYNICIHGVCRYMYAVGNLEEAHCII